MLDREEFAGIALEPTELGLEVAARELERAGVELGDEAGALDKGVELFADDLLPPPLLLPPQPTKNTDTIKANIKPFNMLILRD